MQLFHEQAKNKNKKTAKNCIVIYTVDIQYSQGFGSTTAYKKLKFTNT